MIDKIPELKFNRSEIHPNGKGFYIFIYFHEIFMINDCCYKIIKLINGQRSVKKITTLLQNKYRNRNITKDVCKIITFLENKDLIRYNA